jgi:hypothetical protein
MVWAQGAGCVLQHQKQLRALIMRLTGPQNMSLEGRVLLPSTPTLCVSSHLETSGQFFTKSYRVPLCGIFWKK